MTKLRDATDAQGSSWWCSPPPKQAWQVSSWRCCFHESIACSDLYHGRRWFASLLTHRAEQSSLCHLYQLDDFWPWHPDCWFFASSWWACWLLAGSQSGMARHYFLPWPQATTAYSCSGLIEVGSLWRRSACWRFERWRMFAGCVLDFLTSGYASCRSDLGCVDPSLRNWLLSSCHFLNLPERIHLSLLFQVGRDLRENSQKSFDPLWSRDWEHDSSHQFHHLS